MIAIISNKLDAHANYVERKMRERKVNFVRVNTEDFFESEISIEFLPSTKDELTSFPIISNKLSFLKNISAFWYRRPHPPNFLIEFDKKAKQFVQNETDVVIEGLWRLCKGAHWVNYPKANELASNKIYQLQLAKDLGMEIPKTLITTSPQKALAFFDEFKGRIVTKAISNSWFENDNRISVIRTHLILEQDTEKIGAVRHCPTLFQELIDKSSEIRVTVIGEHLFACEIHSQLNEATKIDYKRDIDSIKHSIYELPDHLAEKCLKLVSKLKLNFAALDFILTPNRKFVFLEANPNGQWLWIEDKTGMPIADTLIEHLISRD